MKALSLWQPWASFVALGAKSIESRSWGTPYRGEIVIHAAKTTAELNGAYALAALARQAGAKIPPLPVPSKWPGLGCVVAVAEIADCFCCGQWWMHAPNERALARREGDGPLLPVRTEIVPTADFILGDLTPGRFAWVLRNVRALPEPVPCRGMQGLFTLPPDVEQRVRLAAPEVVPW